MKKTVAVLGALSTVLFLSSCSTFQSDDQRATICRELKSKMMFSGNTSNTRRSELQNAEDPMLQKQYEKYHCDQY